jgi:hypothetical protein
MPPSNDEIRAAIGAADHALGRTRAAEGQPPAHVNPVPATPARQGFTDDDVASWSQKLFGTGKAKSGRVMNAKD